MPKMSYLEDQKVIGFIDSDKCKDYLDLWAFLMTSELPIRERWAFYLYGKIGFFSSDRTSITDTDKAIQNGEYYHTEIFYWTQFLKNEDKILAEIECELINAGFSDMRPPYNVSYSTIKSIFHERGLKYVRECLENNYASI